MGNDEAIIYGSRHGEWYREYPPGGSVKVDDSGVIDEATAPTKTYYPNAVKLSIIGKTFQIGVVTFDQDTGEQNRFYGDNGNEQWDSLWANLDRDGINRLIRDLRRMRERLYGKDE